ncbi:hypothetical protein FA04_14695 [Ensifer adhaerens]|nr:hypothetical protein FA04_14695 [Ensifer adhaerens]KDP70279.1 hypothetical protein FA04_29005 [Ensifer adhaerens]
MSARSQTVAERDDFYLIEALRECEEYFDNRADAEYFPDSAAPRPNEEMKLLQVVRDAIRKAGA